ncbi:MAG: hypothetical protein LBT00_01395, partial [Spirochaetaceae bacterium]|nr:hypothetical protein [Spirochaetaceae bacterium]
DSSKTQTVTIGSATTKIGLASWADASAAAVTAADGTTAPSSGTITGQAQDAGSGTELGTITAGNEAAKGVLITGAVATANPLATVKGGKVKTTNS